ncbi:hypothetical protein JCM3765_003342 [Sporobolomyces pararoseus]
MRSTLALLALGAASVSAAVIPGNEDIQQMKRNIIARQSKNLIKRNSVTTGADDATILQFALILEHLENTFYSEALQKFDNATFTNAGYPGVYSVLQQVAADEAAHVEFLTAGLKAAGVSNPPEVCKYEFPYTDVKSFLAFSQVVEGLGVSAYLGAAGDIENANYVTAAGSILTVEARHNAFVRLLNSYQPAATPFDTPLSAANVVSIAAPLFVSCPEGSAPTIQPPPGLTLNSTTYSIGSTISVAPTNASAVNTDQQLYCGFASGLDSAFSEWKDNECQIPTQNVTGSQVYLLLTTGPSLDDKSVVAGTAVLELGTPNVTVVSNAAHSNGSSTSASSGSKAATNANSAGSVKTGAVALVGGVFAGALSLLF